MRDALSNGKAINGSALAAVTLDNVTISYDRKPVVHHVTGVFETASLTAVAGPNGAGKSTLLKAIAGILRVNEGAIHIAPNHSPIAYLPQVAEVQRDTPLTVLELVASGFWNRCGSFGAISKRDVQKARDALGTVGLAGFDRRPLASLSVGQFQRLLFARLIVQNARTILLDEPFAAIDAQTMIRLLDVIHMWHREARTVICVLHDLEMIRQAFPQCLLLARECVDWGPTPEVLLADKLTAAGHFQGAWPATPELCLQ